MFEKITVTAKKYNDKESLKSFFDKIIFNNDDFLVLTSKNFKYIKNGKERVKKDRADLIIFKKKWFNAFVFYKDNEKQKFYFNITSPAKIEKDTIDYVDMDIDLVLSSDLEVLEILDLKEFEINKTEYTYTDFFIKKSLEAVEQVKSLKYNKSFLDLIDMVL